MFDYSFTTVSSTPVTGTTLTGFVLDPGAELSIHIKADKENRTLTIQDTGIGMTHDEIIENLGTIAQSGARKFLDAAKDKKVDFAQVIGQFGVGFYSVFMVADWVRVTSRSFNPEAEAVSWYANAGKTALSDEGYQWKVRAALRAQLLDTVLPRWFGDLERHLRDTGLFFPLDPGANATLVTISSWRNVRTACPVSASQRLTWPLSVPTVDTVVNWRLPDPVSTVTLLVPASATAMSMLSLWTSRPTYWMLASVMARLLAKLQRPGRYRPGALV